MQPGRPRVCATGSSGSIASPPRAIVRRMPRTCVCLNPNCDKDVQRCSFGLGRHWRDDALKSILSSLRPKADRDDVEKYFLRAMTNLDAVRVCSRHFFWHTLAWFEGNNPKLVFKDGARTQPMLLESSDVHGRTNRRPGLCRMYITARDSSAHEGPKKGADFRYFKFE